jgi:hypothetical protein
MDGLAGNTSPNTVGANVWVADRTPGQVAFRCQHRSSRGLSSIGIVSARRDKPRRKLSSGYIDALERVKMLRSSPCRHMVSAAGVRQNIGRATVSPAFGGFQKLRRGVDPASRV